MINFKKMGLVAIGASLLVATACGGNGANEASEDELVIGTMMALTGPQAGVSGGYHAMSAYFDDLNDSGGIDGVRIRLEVRDDQFNPAQSPAAARELVDQENTQMMCGSQGTGTFRSVAGYLEQNEVAAVVQSGDSKLFQEPNLGYMMLAPYELAGAHLVRFAVEEREKTTIAVAYTDDGVGLSFLDGARQQAEEMDLELVAEVQFNATATDQSAVAAHLRESGAEVVLANHTSAVLSQVVRAADRVGFEPDWGLTYSSLGPQMVELTGGSLDGRGFWATPFPMFDDPAMAAYLEQMTTRKPDIDPEDVVTIQGWVSAEICADVIRRAIEDVGGVPSGTDLITALNETNLQTETVRGLSWTAESRTGPESLQVVAQQGDSFVTVDEFKESPDISLGQY